MIPTYIISLPDERSRRQHILSECRLLDINPLIIDAVDMRQASQKEIKSLSTIPFHKKLKKQRLLTPGELGCALSHHRAYQFITDNKQSYALILEDDATFIRNPAPLLQETFLNLLQKQYLFDILLIGFVKTPPDQLPYYYRRIPIKYRAAMPFNHETIRFGTPWEQYGCGTVAYIISQTGAQKMLDATQRPCATADDWLYFEQYHGLRILHSRPAFVLENLEDFSSTIRIEKTGYLKPKLSSIVIRSSKGWLKHIAMNYLGFKK